MLSLPFLHPHRAHRSRQIRWIVPAAALAALAIVIAAGAFWEVGDREVGREFFRAHKEVSHTGQLLSDAALTGVALALALLVAATGYGLWLTHRILRPLHLIHGAVDALAEGDLETRVELHHRDEFREVGESINRLAHRLESIAASLDQLAGRAAAAAASPIPFGPGDPALQALAADLGRVSGRLCRSRDAIARRADV